MTTLKNPHIHLTSIILVLISSLLIAGTATATPADNHTTSPIINGTPTSDRQSPVVAVRQRALTYYYLCTGSLIAPNVVLTARHCVTSAAQKMSVYIAGLPFAVTKVTAHPQAHQDKYGLLHNDVALLFLKKPSSKPTLPLLVSRSTQAGDTILIMGYGEDENAQIGVLRKGTSIVSQVSSEYVLTYFSSLNEANSCNGDSGGPAIFSYLDKNNAKHSGIVGTVSFGTVSFGTTERCQIGDYSFYTNTQSRSVLNFITSRVRRVKLQ